MNDNMDPAISLAQPVGDTAGHSKSSIYDNIFLPAKLYEALPATYISVGTLFIVGASYVGIDHLPMVGYLTVGVSCVLAGLTVGIIRRRERSR